MDLFVQIKPRRGEQAPKRVLFHDPGAASLHGRSTVRIIVVDLGTLRRVPFPTRWITLEMVGTALTRIYRFRVHVSAAMPVFSKFLMPMLGE